MIKLVYSNKTERLLEELAGDIRAWREGGAHPLDPVELVVPNRNMETWVRLGLARLTGLAANLRFNWLNNFIAALVARACPGEMKLANLALVEAAVLAALMDEELLNTPALQPVSIYLHSSGAENTGPDPGMHGFDAHLAADGADLRRVQLAARMAFLFQEYSFSRPEMIAAWREASLKNRASGLHGLKSATPEPREQTGGGGFAGFGQTAPMIPGVENAGSGGSGETDPLALGKANDPRASRRAGPQAATQAVDPTGLNLADPSALDPSLATTVAWQRALWQAVFGRGGILEQNPPPEGGRWVTMDLLPFENNFFANIKNKGLPPLHIFGISYLARIFQHLFARLGEVADLHIYSLNPCAEFWEDVDTLRGFYLRLDQELERREQLALREGEATENADPFGLYGNDSLALRYWGRPGAEYMSLLGELTACDFTDAFENPLVEGGGLLQRLQLDILDRSPEQKPVRDPGKERAPGTEKAGNTIKLVAAPSVRREVEWVADEIWRLMRAAQSPAGGAPLRFNEVALIVNSAQRDLYLPMIEAVFAACHDLPCSISDLPGGYGSRMIEAMGLLLKLPFGRFSRSEMLALMEHPAVTGGLADGLTAATPGDLAGIAARLGIIYGADRRDHAGTYIDEDIYNWDQGIRRLALGAFMTGEKSGDPRIFEAGAGRWLVEELFGSTTDVAARFGLLARSLLADARFVRRQKMTLTGWSNFYASQLETYCQAEGEADERDRLLIRRLLGKMETMDLGQEVSGRVAAEIAGRALETLTGSRGEYLAGGVVVSTFLPMRAIPFRAVFLLGLGEGLFPAPAQRDALDLRAVQRREGDVDPSDRDRYMFLENLLCTREKLYLSYVNRDEHTGDTLQPSAPVQELLHILKVNYLGQEGMKELQIEPPLQLRRYDGGDEETGPGYPDTFFDEARAETRVQQIARQWRKQTERRERGRPADGFAQIQHFARPEHREAFTGMLGLPGLPPAVAAVTATARLARRDEEERREALLPLSLPVLRRFLECPMQGWASNQLGLTEVEEDPAEREEEDFEINRLVETNLLTTTFYRVVAGGEISAAEKLYREQLFRLRLAGQVPAGTLGNVIQKRHLGIMEGWFSLLKKLEAEGVFCCSDLHQVRFGRSSRQGSGGVVFDPLLLEVPAAGWPNNGPEEKQQQQQQQQQQQKRIVPVRISGLTDGLSGDRLVSISPRARKLARGGVRQIWLDSFRYVLRGAIALALLAAGNVAGGGERQIIILYADGLKNPGGLHVRLETFDPQSARAWLTGIVADLLGGPHAYLLPCDAVASEYYERGAASRVNGTRLCSLIKNMAENEQAGFSSLWGPVPSPRLYRPPSPGEAVQMVNRRFEPFFKKIIAWQVI